MKKRKFEIKRPFLLNNIFPNADTVFVFCSLYCRIRCKSSIFRQRKICRHTMRIVTALVCRHKSPRRWRPHRTPRKQDESDAPQQKYQPFKLHSLNIITNKRIHKKGRIAAVPFVLRSPVKPGMTTLSVSGMTLGENYSTVMRVTVRLPTLTGLLRSTPFLAFLDGSFAQPSLSFSELLSRVWTVALPLKPGMSSLSS